MHGEAQLNHRSIHHITEYIYYYQIYNNSTCKDMKFYLPDSPIWALGNLYHLSIEDDLCPPFSFPRIYQWSAYIAQSTPIWDYVETQKIFFLKTTEYCESHSFGRMSVYTFKVAKSWLLRCVLPFVWWISSWAFFLSDLSWIRLFYKHTTPVSLHAGIMKQRSHGMESIMHGVQDRYLTYLLRPRHLSFMLPSGTTRPEAHGCCLSVVRWSWGKIFQSQ